MFSNSSNRYIIGVRVPIRVRRASHKRSLLMYWWWEFHTWRHTCSPSHRWSTTSNSRKSMTVLMCSATFSYPRNTNVTTTLVVATIYPIHSVCIVAPWPGPAIATLPTPSTNKHLIKTYPQKIPFYRLIDTQTIPIHPSPLLLPYIIEIYHHAKPSGPPALPVFPLCYCHWFCYQYETSNSCSPHSSVHFCDCSNNSNIYNLLSSLLFLIGRPSFRHGSHCQWIVGPQYPERSSQISHLCRCDAAACR